MTAREYRRWLAYYKINPFGPVRGDLNAATVAMVIANTHRDPKSKAFTVEDFMPDFDGETETDRYKPVSPQRIHEVIAGSLAMMGVPIPKPPKG